MKIKAIEYQIEVAFNPHDFSRDHTYCIREVHVPEYNMFINDKACFMEKDLLMVETRLQDIKDVKEIEVDLEDARRLSVSIIEADSVKKKKEEEQKAFLAIIDENKRKEQLKLDIGDRRPDWVEEEQNGNST